MSCNIEKLGYGGVVPLMVLDINSPMANMTAECAAIQQIALIYRHIGRGNL